MAIFNGMKQTLNRHLLAEMKPRHFYQLRKYCIKYLTLVLRKSMLIIRYKSAVLKSVKLTNSHSWVQDLAANVERQGLDVVEFSSSSFPDYLLHFVTKTHLSAHAELLDSAYKHRDLSLPPQAEARRALFKLVQATKHGAVYHWSPVLLLARKPSA